MSFLGELMDGETGFVSAEVRNQGAELAEQYASGQPFPNISIDDFLPPSVLEICLEDFPGQLGRNDTHFDAAQEKLKSQFSPDTLSPRTRALFYSFNSRPFIRIVENITGINGLIPDPYYIGAGFHEIGTGGYLGVHVDFNHHKLMNLQRRVNMLIYLNKDWSDDCGGQLELWNEDMSRCVKSISPVFNSCAIFSTSESSYHGNPNPINHPQGSTRKSIALYYYTATWSDQSKEHTTRFRVRPGSADKPATSTALRELVSDLVPPILMRGIRGLRNRAGA